MGRDFHAYLEHYNYKTHKWEAVQLFKKKDEHFKEIPFIEGGWSDGIDILEDEANCYPALEGIHQIEEETLSPEVKTHYENLFSTEEEKKILHPGYFGLGMINLSNIKIYTLQYPMVPDYDAEWPSDVESSKDPDVPKIKNPLSYILESAIQYININDDMAFLNDDLSDYRMIYWGDC